MHNLQFFLGFQCDGALADLLERIDPKKRALFINQADLYLQKVVHQNSTYLGKCIGEMKTVEELELIKVNIYTIMLKLIPPFDSTKFPMLLFPIFKNDG
jgi:hypothetical protein